ncbi:hypothetical protein QBL02_13020 [Leucobacter sp. UT-8R-CII-1-4]|uniref:hypothetical protein n=1 Tax=Leucobacter sp. UT-8R-CII-1-4 TaxID=3040075 RepID=UPI0024A9A36F|nr:hypothetical protein [Leucobacter sp. UT-8R-CII-1-4]MDI6024462.1 hypothetical protein [Leucobacter sp. UT-8R-CII-1-4]
MFELDNSELETRFIDFGSKGKVLFQLPVLGDDGVPMGIMSAFGIFWDKFQQARDLTESEVASAWSFFIQTLADSYPDATRQLARLDRNQFKGVLEHWVQKSQEIAGYDPKQH